MGKIIQFNRDLIIYRRMWIDDRWKFSADMVRLTIKKSKDELTEEEQHTLDTLNRVVEENGGRWLEEIPNHRKR